jgi:hypothetical protein
MAFRNRQGAVLKAANAARDFDGSIAPASALREAKI